MFPSGTRDLITVPACQPCNRGFSADDEYFRIALLSPIARRDARALELWFGPVVRGLRRSITERRSRFAIEFHDSLKEIEERDEDGRVVGMVPARRIYPERLGLTLSRVVQALLWHEYSVHPGQGFRVVTLSMGYLRSDGAAAFASRVGITPASRRAAGNDIFEYWHRVYDAGHSDWILTFYGVLGFWVRFIPGGTPAAESEHGRGAISPGD